MGSRSVYAVSYGKNMRPAISGERLGVYAEGASSNARLVPGVSEVIDTEEPTSAIPKCSSKTKDGSDCLARPIADTEICWFHKDKQ